MGLEIGEEITIGKETLKVAGKNEKVSCSFWIHRSSLWMSGTAQQVLLGTIPSRQHDDC